MEKMKKIKDRIELFQKVEGQLATAGSSKNDSITIRQSMIEVNYYADVSDLLDIIGTALYELEKLEPLLNIPNRGYVRNNFNALLRTLKGEMIE